MKEKIAAAENMRREFIASISHDLRTPLTTINGFIQGILDGLIKPEETPRYLGIIRQETIRLMNLTGDILESAKLQSGGIKLCRKYFPLRDFLESFLESAGIKYNNKNIQIVVDCPQSLEIYADEERLKQILDNIISNALKFTGDNGQIIIRAAETPAETLIQIKDNGQGIAPEDLPFIFDKFYRGDKSRHESTGGTGLGLNIVKNLLKLHGGKIEAFSELGKGTTMTVRFPR